MSNDIFFCFHWSFGPLETLKGPDSNDDKRLDIVSAVPEYLPVFKFIGEWTFPVTLKISYSKVEKANQEKHLVCQIQASCA